MPEEVALDVPESAGVRRRWRAPAMGGTDLGSSLRLGAARSLLGG